MTFLKQWATHDNASTAGSKPLVGVTATRLIPTTEPTDTAYVNWKAKNYSAALRFMKTTQTGYRCKYDLGQMWRYQKILRRNSKLGKVAMAA